MVLLAEYSINYKKWRLPWFLLILSLDTIHRDDWFTSPVHQGREDRELVSSPAVSQRLAAVLFRRWTQYVQQICVYLFATNYLAWNTQTRCFCAVQIRLPCCSLEWLWLGWIIKTSYSVGIDERYEHIRTYPWPRNESLSVHSGCSCKARVYQTLFQVILFGMWQIMLITT